MGHTEYYKYGFCPDLPTKADLYKSIAVLSQINEGLDPNLTLTFHDLSLATSEVGSSVMTALSHADLKWNDTYRESPVCQLTSEAVFRLPENRTMKIVNHRTFIEIGTVRISILEGEAWLGRQNGIPVPSVKVDVPVGRSTPEFAQSFAESFGLDPFGEHVDHSMRDGVEIWSAFLPVIDEKGNVNQDALKRYVAGLKDAMNFVVEYLFSQVDFVYN